MAVCLILFTVYFREGGDGPAHGTQRLAGTVVAPLQSVGSRIAEPFTGAWDWVTGLFDARGENERLKEENAALRETLAIEQERSLYWRSIAARKEAQP